MDRYKPRSHWFQHNPYGIHGLGHAARVLVWASILAKGRLEDGEMVDVEAVRWAAALHDLGRLDDGRDPQHGERSADWLSKHLPSIAPEMSPAQRATVDYCCRWHVPPDSSAPALTAELCCLKDADGLDRARLGDLKIELLRSERARQMVSAAQELYIATKSVDGRDQWDLVRAAAIDRGLWT